MAYLAVAVGGFLGACARFFLTEWLGALNGFPLATLSINLTGSFALSWLYTITLERIPLHPHLRVGIGTGFIGAYTTFSTINVELWSLIANRVIDVAVLYGVLTYLGGIFCAVAGYYLAMRQSRLHLARSERSVSQ